MTIKQLKHRINRTTEALERERRKNTEIVSGVGWGSGMRKVCIGPSYRRENELIARLENYKDMLKKMEENYDY